MSFTQPSPVAGILCVHKYYLIVNPLYRVAGETVIERLSDDRVSAHQAACYRVSGVDSPSLRRKEDKEEIFIKNVYIIASGRAFYDYGDR